MNTGRSRFRPVNVVEMRDAQSAFNAAMADPLVTEDVRTVMLSDVSYNSLCTGCTDPESPNYDPYAEIDDGTCV